jgi:hypothetical protein
MVIRRSSDDAQPFGDPRPLGRAYRLVVPTRIEGGDVHASFFAVRLEAGRVEPNRLLRVSGLIVSANFGAPIQVCVVLR